MKLIYITTSEAKETRNIGKTLIEEGLAACVNMFPEISSIFKWKGKLQESKESAAFIKVPDENVDKVIERVKEMHSYESPCVISLEVNEGNASFMNWVEGAGKAD